MSYEKLRRRSIESLMALGAAFALTTVHHLYGGIVDGSTGRLLIPLVLAPAFLAAIGALMAYRRGRNRVPVIAYSAIVGIVVIGLLGIFHGLYAHVYKDLVFILGLPTSFYVALNPDEHFPPDDLFFEVTGVLEVATAALVAITTVRVLTAARRTSGRRAPEEVPDPADV